MKVATDGDCRLARTPYDPCTALWFGLTLLLLGCGLAAVAQDATLPDWRSHCDAPLAHMNPSSATPGWTTVIAKIPSALNAEEARQLGALGADIYRHLPVINSVAMRVPTRNLTRLARLPFVSHLSLDGGVRKNDLFTVGSSLASVAWASPYHLNGQGVTVAVVDSGFAPQAAPFDLGGSRILTAVNFVSSDSNPAENTTFDLCGHGTHVSGIIAGDGSASSGPDCFQTYYGIAPQASIVAVRVLDTNGESTVSTVIAGLQWVVNNAAHYNIRVINLSLGQPVGDYYANDPLCQAVEAAYNAGIVVVCAAGNTGRIQNTVDSTLGNKATAPTTARSSRQATIPTSSPWAPPSRSTAYARTMRSPPTPAAARPRRTWCSSPTSLPLATWSPRCTQSIRRWTSSMPCRTAFPAPSTPPTRTRVRPSTLCCRAPRCRRRSCRARRR